MAMIYSGPMSMGTSIAPVSGKNSSIVTEEGGSPTTNISLRSLSSVAGKTSPDAMSEFYAYSYISKTFVGSAILNAPTTAGPNTNTIVVSGAATTVYCTAFGGISVGCTCQGTIKVGTTAGGTQIGTRTTGIAGQYATSNSTTLAVPIGTYYFQITGVYSATIAGQWVQIT